MSEHSENFASSSLDKSIRFFLWSIIISSVLIRGFLAWYVELGNDEVYYWTYALYPDWSHFDHPPMVGFFYLADNPKSSLRQRIVFAFELGNPWRSKYLFGL